MPVTVPEDPSGNVLSGRDLRGGGTWLGITRTGRVTFLYVSFYSLSMVSAFQNTDKTTVRTNITEELKQYETTRGELNSSFLHPNPEDETLEAHVTRLTEENKSYAGFNLLLLAPAQLSSGSDHEGDRALSFDAAYVTNSGGGGKIISRPLTDAERRRGGLSNGVDGHGADQWPKVQQGLQLFGDVLQSTTPETTDMDLVESLLKVLTWVFSIHAVNRGVSCYSSDAARFP